MTDECDIAPVVVRSVPAEKAKEMLVEYLHVAFSFVVAVRVACVVPDGSDDTGPVMVTSGGVVSAGGGGDCVVTLIAVERAEALGTASTARTV
jgi:hypothetical protein